MAKISTYLLFLYLSLNSLKVCKEVIKLTPEPKLIIIEPNGPQGQKVGVEIRNKTQFKAFDKAVGKLPESERKTVEGLTKAAQETGVRVIED